MSEGIQISSPSRLHFGLLSFGDTTRRQFGGVGAMLAEPRVELLFEASDVFEVCGAMSDRIVEFANRWSQATGHALRCRISAQSVIPPHVGLGSGTQLGLSVAAGLNHFFNCAPRELVDLATSVNRGLRSAVGSYGFMQGGLIAEAGKLAGEALAPLTARVELPSAWRFVLIRPKGGCGLSGSEEVSAFATLPPVSKEMTKRLERILNDELLPATAESDYERFGDAVYRYGRLAGECFAPCQGGPYASPALMEIVNWLREHSVAGVGQSSWGPTMFALQPDLATAERLVEILGQWQDGGLELQICSVDNQGMRVTQHCNSSSTI